MTKDGNIFGSSCVNLLLWSHFKLINYISPWHMLILKSTCYIVWQNLPHTKNLSSLPVLDSKLYWHMSKGPDGMLTRARFYLPLYIGIKRLHKGWNRHCLMYLCHHKRFYSGTNGEQIDLPNLCCDALMAATKDSVKQCCFITVDIYLLSSHPRQQLKGPKTLHFGNFCAGSGPSSPRCTLPSFPQDLQGCISVNKESQNGSRWKGTRPKESPMPHASIAGPLPSCWVLHWPMLQV